MSSTFDRIQSILADISGMDLSVITSAASISGDLCLDSLDVCELEMELDEAFDISIDEGIAQTWQTVADIEQYVKTAIADREMQGAGA